MFDQINLKMSTFNGQSMRVTDDGLQQTCQEKRFIIKYAPRNKCNDSKPGFTVHLGYFTKGAAPGDLGDIMLRVSREVESTVPRIPARGLHATTMPQNSEYSLRIRFDGDTFSVRWRKPVSAGGIIYVARISYNSVEYIIAN